MADKLAFKQGLRHASQAIVITRQNLFAVCSLCVKSILDRACFQVVDESSLDLQNFLNIIETIFFFQFKGNIDNKRNPYSVLKYCATKNTSHLFHTIESLDKLNHFIGKFRAAIRLALMNKCLYILLETLLAKRSALELHYFEDSVFRCPDAAALVSQLAGLDALDLSFDLRSPSLIEQLCYPRTCPIDYAAHMKLLVLDEAKLDDQIELAADASSPEAAILTAEDTSEPQLADCPHCDWRNRYLRVEAQLKRTAEQKSYLEEVNKRITEERDGANAAREAAKLEQAKEIKLYESVVLELQVQLTLLQEQYNRRLATASVAASVHAGDGVTRPRLPQLDRQDSDPLQQVSVNDEFCEIESQEFDEDTAAYRAPNSASGKLENSSEPFGYTEVERRLLEVDESAAGSSVEAASGSAQTATSVTPTASGLLESQQHQRESSNDSSDLVRVDSVCDSAEVLSNSTDQDDPVLDANSAAAAPTAAASAAAEGSHHQPADPSAYYSLMPQSTGAENAATSSTEQPSSNN